MNSRISIGSANPWSGFSPDSKTRRAKNCSSMSKPTLKKRTRWVMEIIDQPDIIAEFNPEILGKEISFQEQKRQKPDLHQQHPVLFPGCQRRPYPRGSEHNLGRECHARHAHTQSAYMTWRPRCSGCLTRPSQGTCREKSCKTLSRRPNISPSMWIPILAR